jgi:hypothetical protein
MPGKGSHLATALQQPCGNVAAGVTERACDNIHRQNYLRMERRPLRAMPGVVGAVRQALVSHILGGTGFERVSCSLNFIS